ncbi:hypothetical protein GKZ89_16770 [Bacillus mangrovi]|uniref:Uncharacterized protein n=1 Tax=Metabacillus mangrovi TaxID=1491830 RepID=A0A7X2S7H4_9BACI|nr:DUF6470 family protein [Metabacillus mangrovi]MTH55059.1 hypothetical protein [Metabacillus mangrovi]
MKIPQIRIQSTPGKIGHTTIQPRMEQQQPKPSLSIQQPKADLTIETTKGELSIDTTEARADVDLKHISRRIQEFAQQGYQDWLEGMARVSSQGDDLMKIENGGNPIPEQARANSESPIYDFNIAFIPRAGGVKLNYTPAQVKIDAEPRKPVIDVQINKPILDYTPGDTEFDMLQYPDLDIRFETIDIKV